MKKFIREYFIPTDQKKAKEKFFSHNPDSRELSNYEMRGIDFFYTSLFNRERLPNHISELLPKVVHKIFIPYDEIDNFKEWILKNISPELEETLKGSFFKLSGRSAKDVSDNIFNSVEDLFEAREHSERWITDLIDAKRMSSGVYLYFLERLNFDISRELRVFIYGGKIKGISVYDYMSKTNKLSDGFVDKVIKAVEEKILSPMLKKVDILPQQKKAEGTIEDKLALLEKLISAPPSPKDSGWDLLEFVIDVCEMPDGNVQFIEVNPYFLSDPCCYKDYDEIGTPFFNNTPKIPEYMSYLKSK